jgi:16S rRNA (cytosine1402-N4)-methyltransferase
VNREEEELEQFLSCIPATISLGGRLVVLSYHSIEDRSVKHAIQRLTREGRFQVLTKRVIRPSDEEIRRNPRARSAKLRVAEKIAPAEEPAAGSWT